MLSKHILMEMKIRGIEYEYEKEKEKEKPSLRENIVNITKTARSLCIDEICIEQMSVEELFWKKKVEHYMLVLKEEKERLKFLWNHF